MIEVLFLGIFEVRPPLLILSFLPESACESRHIRRQIRELRVRLACLVHSTRQQTCRAGHVEAASTCQHLSCRRVYATATQAYSEICRTLGRIVDPADSAYNLSLAARPEGSVGDAAGTLSGPAREATRAQALTPMMTAPIPAKTSVQVSPAPPISDSPLMA